MVEIPNAAQAMGSIPSGLFILTTGRGDEATGLLTSFVQQAGFDPLAVTVAIQRQRDVAELIRREKAFCLSILHRESKQLLAHFARGFEEDRELQAVVHYNPAQFDLQYAVGGPAK